MFSALTNYFFGPEKPLLDEADDIDYPTKEEGGWTVVDVPKPQEQENSISAIEDDILESVACLLPLETSWAEPTKKKPKRHSPIQTSLSEDTFYGEQIDRRINEFTSAVRGPYKRTRLERFENVRLQDGAFSYEYQRIVYIMTDKKICEQAKAIMKAILAENRAKRDSDVETIPKDNPPCAAKKSEHNADGKKASRIKPKPYSSKWKYEAAKTHSLTCAFVNTSPILTSKAETLQQIKDLKPAQQVREYEMKKHIKKAQLNRQNRAYLYESSNKNKHRRDLWMRHSGANNNRKCC